MIEHINIHFPELIKSQKMLNLGKINILTGKNSSGKSTILGRILSKPDYGITIHSSEKIQSVVREQIGNYAKPSNQAIDDWVKNILTLIDGKIFFNSSEEEVYPIILDAKNNSAVNIFGLAEDIKRVSKALTTYFVDPEKVLLLSPKRRLLYETQANATKTLDSEASGVLSRLFFLKNQLPDSEDRKLFDRIHDSFRGITGRDFDIQMLSDRQPPGILLQFKRLEGPWVVANNEGLGLSEILSIIHYSLDGSYRLLLIEEPENHLHPDLQRKLLSFLNSIHNRQFILSTHSPTFLNPTMVDRIYMCRFIDGEIKIADDTRRADILLNLGVLAIDNLTSDAVIITEGKTDQFVIDYILNKWMNCPPSISVSYVFLAGSMMVYFDPTPFAELRSTFALLDRDTSNSSAQKSFIEKSTKSGIVPTQLKRYCLENYYTLDAIKETFKGIIKEGIKTIDHSIPPWKQLADSDHDENWWKGELKSYRRIISILSNMNISDINGTDLFEFCQSIKIVL